jgi:hypothetical protein
MAPYMSLKRIEFGRGFNRIARVSNCLREIYYLTKMHIIFSRCSDFSNINPTARYRGESGSLITGAQIDSGGDWAGLDASELVWLREGDCVWTEICIILDIR